MNNGLIEDIKRLQTLKGLSNTELARQIGVDPSAWSKIKSGQRNMGGRFLRGVINAFPELHLSVLKVER